MPYTFLAIPVLCLASEYLCWLRPLERRRLKAEITKHLPKATKPQARAVLKRMLKDELRVSSFTWHDDFIFDGRGKYSKLCHKSGKWISPPPAMIEVLNNYGVEREILKQKHPDLLMNLNNADAKSICALMYFGWEIASFENVDCDTSGRQIKISLSRRGKMIERLINMTWLEPEA